MKKKKICDMEIKIAEFGQTTFKAKGKPFKVRNELNSFLTSKLS